MREGINCLSYERTFSERKDPKPGEEKNAKTAEGSTGEGKAGKKGKKGNGQPGLRTRLEKCHKACRRKRDVPLIIGEVAL